MDRVLGFLGRHSKPNVGYHLARHLVVGFLLGGLIAGCATTSRVAPTATTKPFPAAAGLGRVALLPPWVGGERIQDGTPVETIVGEDAIGAELLRAATTMMEARGVPRDHLATVQPMTAPDRAMATRLCAETARLFAITQFPELHATLRAFASASGAQTVLALQAKVRLGPEGYWDPSSGRIGSPMTSTLLRVALIDPVAGTLLWDSQVLLREAPDPGSRGFQQALAALLPR